RTGPNGDIELPAVFRLPEEIGRRRPPNSTPHRPWRFRHSGIPTACPAGTIRAACTRVREQGQLSGRGRLVPPCACSESVRREHLLLPGQDRRGAEPDGAREGDAKEEPLPRFGL